MNCRIALVIAVLLAFSGCQKEEPHQWQGYVEGEYVYVASPLAGQLETLSVQRGDQVKTNDPLFTLDTTSEIAARDEAKRRVDQAVANVQDMKKGKRPSEMDSMQAQLKQAEAAAEYSASAFARNEQLVSTGGVSQLDLEKSRSTRDQDLQHITQLKADIATAQLGSREDQITAAEHDMAALEASLRSAEWNLSQKQQLAPQTGVVFDTLYRQGEWVAAGHPVVALLPPANIKIRAFVPETEIAKLHYGDVIRVSMDGVPGSIPAKVSFISPQAEYTPPVIYSNESRSKLVFMIEAVFDPADAVKLHPGQPVDVRSGP